MTGFLDPKAPSIEAEYARYVEGDILGKIVFKNFALNVLGLSEDTILIPLGRWGDAGSTLVPTADVVVADGDRRLDVEIKCVRVNIANRYKGGSRKNWAFSSLTRTRNKKNAKQYDLAVCIGVMLLGLEDPRYWSYLDEYEKKMAAENIVVTPRALPHERTYLSMCGFFLIPARDLSTNYFRATVGGVDRHRYGRHFAWGHHEARCKELWARAVRAVPRR